jgi:DNA-binding NarL/FixJ family response regulator/multidrug resistance efflux pump
MIRILLVDDQKMVREALKVFLEPEADFQIIGTADNGYTAIEKVEQLRPDIVLIDMEMPLLDGVNATKTITKQFADTKVLILSSYDRDEYIAQSLSVGAKGYLLKDTAPQEIAEAIRSVYKGYSQIGPGLLEKLLVQSESSITLSNVNVPANNSLSTEKQIVSITKSNPNEILSVASEVPEKSNIWQRLLVGTTFVSLAVAGIAVGSIALSHRFSNLVLETGSINGRILRLRTPINGKLEEFYPRPGVFVQPNQLLARIQSTSEKSLAIPQLQGEIQSKSKQLLSAKQLLVFLQGSLQQQEDSLQQQKNQHDRASQVEVKLDNGQVKQQQAVVDKAIAQAKLARLDYERLNKLQQQGVISQQKVDQAKATWEIAEAEVRAAQESLRSAQIAFNDAQQKVIRKEYLNWDNKIISETAQLKQQILNQSLVINNLETELTLAQQQLEQLRSRDRDSQQVEIKSPLAAVVYSTEREQGELIQESEELLTLLDCNDIWVETVVNAKDATKIDIEKPVLVELAGESQPIEGQVALIQAVSSQGEQERSQRLQSQALVPTIPTDLIGQNLSRITVTIPPPSNYSQTNKFCGLGQPSRLTFATHQKIQTPELLTSQWQKFKKIFAVKS